MSQLGITRACCRLGERRRRRVAAERRRAEPACLCCSTAWRHRLPPCSCASLPMPLTMAPCAAQVHGEQVRCGHPPRIHPGGRGVHPAGGGARRLLPRPAHQGRANAGSPGVEAERGACGWCTNCQLTVLNALSSRAMAQVVQSVLAAALLFVAKEEITSEARGGRAGCVQVGPLVRQTLPHGKPALRCSMLHHPG